MTTENHKTLKRLKQERDSALADVSALLGEINKLREEIIHLNQRAAIHTITQRETLEKIKCLADNFIEYGAISRLAGELLNRLATYEPV